MNGPWRYDALARYNTEVSRGIVHTPEVDDWMRREQEAFDQEQQARLIAEGFREVAPGIWMGEVPHRAKRRWFRWFRRVARKG